MKSNLLWYCTRDLSFNCFCSGHPAGGFQWALSLQILFHNFFHKEKNCNVCNFNQPDRLTYFSSSVFLQGDSRWVTWSKNQRNIVSTTKNHIHNSHKSKESSSLHWYASIITLRFLSQQLPYVLARMCGHHSHTSREANYMTAPMHFLQGRVFCCATPLYSTGISCLPGGPPKHDERVSLWASERPPMMFEVVTRTVSKRVRFQVYPMYATNAQ